MATLQSIAELAFRQINPNPNDEVANTLPEYIETAKVEYAYRLWEKNKADMKEGMDNNVPPNLLSFGDLIVDLETNRADIKELKALTSLQDNTWIQSLGGIECGKCRYVLMDVNKYKLLCDDDSRGDDKAAIVVGKEIYFPDGIFSKKDNKVPIIYANTGKSTDDLVEVEDAIGGLIRRSLIDIYGKKFPEDKTNQSNGNN